MKWIVFVVLILIVGAVVGVSILPMSMAADFASRQAKTFKYAGATGTVWNGKLQGVVFNGQALGDLSIKADAGKLFVGQAAGHVGMVGKDLTGEASIAKALFGKRLKLTDIKLSGQTAGVPVLPARIRAANGRFTLVASEILFNKGVCQAASGEVWTDVLARADLGHNWVGPEVRGPVACKDGKLDVAATGKAQTGEDVTAALHTGPDLGLELEAKVTNATQGAVDTLTELGFQPDSGAYVLRAKLGRPVAAAQTPAAGQVR
jgi:hypothetical protein